MKKLALVISLFASTSVNAAAATNWISQENTGALGDNVYAALYESTDGIKRIGVFAPSEGCVGYSQNASPLMAVKVSTQWIDYSVQCIDHGRAVFFPTTKEGNAQAIGIFMKRKKVTIATSIGTKLEFSARGFARHYNIVRWS